MCLCGGFPGSQGLRFRAPAAGGMGSIPGRGTKIPHAMWHGQKFKKRYVCAKIYYFNATGVLNTMMNVKGNNLHYL